MILTYDKRQPTIDGLSLFSLSNQMGFDTNDVRVLPLKSLATQNALEQCFQLTIQKYKKWPYRPNKRAEKFFLKNYKQLFQTKRQCLHEQIVKTVNGFDVYINMSMVNNETHIIDTVFSIFNEIYVGDPISLGKRYYVSPDVDAYEEEEEI